MSGLRIAGLIIGVAGLVATFVFFRGPKWNRLNFAFFSLVNISLIAVTLNPNIVNFLRDLLALQEYQYGRILALLIISNLIFLFVSIYSASKIETFRLQFDKLVRKLGSDQLEPVSEKIHAITVLIPAYNEAENLKHLLPKIPETVDGLHVCVIVVDDGSDDATPDIVREHGHLVVSNIINRGGGAALRLGYDILRVSPADICITMDADGQHKPEDIENLILPITKEGADVVIGSRILGSREKDNPVRLAGVHLFGTVISSLLGKRITDPSSGFRAFKMDKIKHIDLREDQYHTSELIIEAVKKGLHVTEVPVNILKRTYGKSKKGRNLKYGFHFAKTILKTWWRQ